MLSTPADIAAWIAERKKRFPTKARIEQKRAEQEQRQGLLSKARRKASDAPQEPRIDKHQGQGRLPPATGQTKAGVDGKKGGWPGRGGRRAFAGSPSGGILPNPPLAGIISASGALIHSQKDAMDVCFTDNRLAQAKIMDSRSDDELGKSESVLMNNPASPESSFKLGLNLCYSSSSSESHSLGNNDLNGANDSDESLSAVSSSEASDSSSDDTSDAEYAVSISANTAADSIDVASEKQLALSCTGERHRLTDKFPTQLRGRGPPHLRPNFSLSSRSPAKLARRSGTKPTLYERVSLLSGHRSMNCN